MVTPSHHHRDAFGGSRPSEAPSSRWAGTCGPAVRPSGQAGLSPPETLPFGLFPRVASMPPAAWSWGPVAPPPAGATQASPGPAPPMSLSPTPSAHPVLSRLPHALQPALFRPPLPSLPPAIPLFPLLLSTSWAPLLSLLSQLLQTQPLHTGTLKGPAPGSLPSL